MNTNKRLAVMPLVFTGLALAAALYIVAFVSIEPRGWPEFYGLLQQLGAIVLLALVAVGIFLLVKRRNLRRRSKGYTYVYFTCLEHRVINSMTAGVCPLCRKPFEVVSN